jgi:hypothetical protein
VTSACGDTQRLEAIAAELPWCSPVPWARPPARVDLRPWMPAVVDQFKHPTCTAAVVAGIAGYFERRLQRGEFVASLLFNYRMSRILSGNPDRRGSLLRLAFAAWREYGLLDDRLWPFAPERVDVDPPGSCRRAALARRDVEYWRVDEPDLDPKTYLALVRRCLLLGVPLSVEFPLHPTLVTSFRTGVIPPPRSGEPSFGRHVVLLVGYDDTLLLPCASAPGALLIHNSWGERWGCDGYGWLPYDFAFAGLLRDSWAAVPDAGLGRQPRAS